MGDNTDSTDCYFVKQCMLQLSVIALNVLLSFDRGLTVKKPLYLKIYARLKIMVSAYK